MLDHIARVRPAARRRRPAASGARGDDRRAPTAGISIGGAPWTAHLDTVEILKERQILDRRVYVVRFEADHLRAGRIEMTMVVRAERTPGAGWVARGISAGASVPEPELETPRVLLGGSWGRFGFCGGGRVCAAPPEVERVRLRFGNGIELEDDTEQGWALFFTDRPVERPAGNRRAARSGRRRRRDAPVAGRPRAAGRAAAPHPARALAPRVGTPFRASARQNGAGAPDSLHPLGDRRARRSDRDPPLRRRRTRSPCS